jgi:hypothetical protein
VNRNRKAPADGQLDPCILECLDQGLELCDEVQCHASVAYRR